MKTNITQELLEFTIIPWESLKQGPFPEWVKSHRVDKMLYQIFMGEIFHYTKHNSINQAFACINLPSRAEKMLKYIYRHAADEYGHEKMVVRDLESINLLDHEKLEQPPLPATEALIGYLYSVPIRYGAIARLGYSLWAENAYDHIAFIINKIRHDLSLSDKNMSFFVAHSKIDQRHSAQVAKAINNYCTTNENKEQVKIVASTTLHLTSKMLDGVLEHYLKTRDSSNQYA